MIYVKQLEPNSLTTFIINAMSGAALSGSLAPYFQSNGWVGDNVVYTTGAQSITGSKRFLDPILVGYSGGTGAAPSTLFVLDQIAALNTSASALYLNRGLTPDIISGLKVFTGALQVGNPTATGHAVNLFTLTGATGSLTSLRVTGSNPIQAATLSGLGGTIILWSGNNIFISGAAGGAGSSNTSVTGSSAISDPNFTGRGSVVVTYDGTYVNVSGSASSTDTVLSGYLENNFVHRGLINDNISGLKTFTGAVGVGNPTSTGHAINLGYLTGASGILQGQITAAVPITNNYTFSGLTGNYINMAFFFDPYNLATGLNMVEAFVGRDFFFTGYALGVYNSGTQGFLSGSLYQRNTTNIKTRFQDFSLNSGVVWTGFGGFNQTISGMNRVGIDILNLGTGMTGFSIGIFGVGY